MGWLSLRFFHGVRPRASCLTNLTDWVISLRKLSWNVNWIMKCCKLQIRIISGKSNVKWNAFTSLFFTELLWPLGINNVLCFNKKRMATAPSEQSLIEESIFFVVSRYILSRCNETCNRLKQFKKPWIQSGMVGWKIQSKKEKLKGWKKPGVLGHNLISIKNWMSVTHNYHRPRETWNCVYS